MELYSDYHPLRGDAHPSLVFGILGYPDVIGAKVHDTHFDQSLAKLGWVFQNDSQNALAKEQV